jgi:hypothetical protein
VAEVAVHIATNEIDAEAAAAALRANRLHPRVALDPGSPFLGIIGRATIGPHVVLVPENEAKAAREILREGDRRG